MEITGLILSGGESKRMGTDKGLLIKNNQPWVCLMGNKFFDVDLVYKVSINQSQALSYQAFFKQDDLVVDCLDIPGPLKGILTAHLKYPMNNWLVLACDMIDMDKAVIMEIIEAFKSSPGFDFYVYKNESFYEPFCGIYTAHGLQKLYSKYSNQEIENFSLQKVFNNFSTYSCSVGKNAHAFKNYNQL